MDLNNKARRNQYFIEWRVKDPSIKKGMEELQNKIRPIDPNILMDQSCGIDNMHITMNQFKLFSIGEVEKVITLLKRFQREELKKLVPDKKSVLMEVNGNLCHFKRRVIYAPVCNKPRKEYSGSVLVAIFDRLQKRLRSAGFKPLERPLEPHLTICKAKRLKGGSSSFSSETFEKIMGHSKDKTIGKQWLCSLVFCTKRLKTETTPPVVYAIDF
ncbi:hypothetical protein AAMO2058_001230200 [Amorphochlora amoebiformis]